MSGKITKEEVDAMNGFIGIVFLIFCGLVVLTVAIIPLGIAYWLGLGIIGYIVLGVIGLTIAAFVGMLILMFLSYAADLALKEQTKKKGTVAEAIDNLSDPHWSATPKDWRKVK